MYDLRDTAMASPYIAARRRIGPSTFIVAGIVLLFAIMNIATGGPGGLLVALGFASILTGLYVVITGRRSWAYLPGRKIGALTFLLGLVVTGVGGGIISATHPSAASSQVKQKESMQPSADTLTTAEPKPAPPKAAAKVEEPAASPAPEVEPPAVVVESVVPSAPVVPAPAAAGSGPVFYQNCDAVRAAGKAPLLADQPGYTKKMDQDGDGIACEAPK